MVIKKPALVALIISNCAPLVGVLFFNWNLFSVLFLYWAENLVIGFYTIVKILKSTQPGRNPIQHGNRKYASKIAYCLFFIVHYGLFTFAHGVFVFAFFGTKSISYTNILIGVFLLLISHGLSYFTNYIGNKEFEKVSPDVLFTQPYSRVTIMHITIIVGSFVIMIFNLPILALVTLIILKIIADIYLHTIEHKSLT